MFLANVHDCQKVFLHAYLWFGFCGAASILGLYRFSKLFIAKKIPNYHNIASGLEKQTPAIEAAHNLSVWVSSSIGLACLAAQFYFHQYKIVT